LTTAVGQGSGFLRVALKGEDRIFVKDFAGRHVLHHANQSVQPRLRSKCTFDGISHRVDREGRMLELAKRGSDGVIHHLDRS
jgi:hypothetical protein